MNIDRAKTPSGWWLVTKRKSGFFANYHHGDFYREIGPFETRKEANLATWTHEFKDLGQRVP